MLLFIAGVTYAINLTSVTTQTVSAPWSADAGWYQQVNDRLVNIFASGTNVGAVSYTHLIGILSYDFDEALAHIFRSIVCECET